MESGTTILDPETVFFSHDTKIGKDVEIEANIVFGENVTINEGSELISHVNISGNTTIGMNNLFYPFSSIGSIPQDLKYQGEKSKLIIKNERDSKHYFTSTLFAKSIFTRKVQVSLNNKKVAEIKGIINNVEVWPNHQLEWWFVPIKTGVFKDLYCNVKDTKTNLSHANMGMTGTCLLYTSPSPRDRQKSRMPSSA